MPTMENSPPIITLLTDFGGNDSYVGAMKGVILGIAPTARLIDITHEIEPQNIHQAAHIIKRSAPYFPANTIHLIVVDPGVGSDRRPIAVKTPHGYYVAPDNGVLTDVLPSTDEYEAISLENPKYWLNPSPSQTFHGRDIFSPAAAHLAAGVAIAELGPKLRKPVLLPRPPLELTKKSIRGEVHYIDHFGNVISNIQSLEWMDQDRLSFKPLNGHDAVEFEAKTARVMVGWHTFNGILPNYSATQQGEALALVGSGGELEIAINQGNAGYRLALNIGDPVTLQFTPPE